MKNIFICFILVYLLLGCGIGVTNSSHLVSNIRFDQLAEVPVINGQGHQYALWVRNYSNQQMNGLTYQLANHIDSNALEDINGFKLDKDSILQCSEIAPYTDCKIIFSVSNLALNDANSALIKLSYNDNGEIKNSEQIVNYRYYQLDKFNGLNFTTLQDTAKPNDYVTLYLFVGADSNQYNGLNLSDGKNKINWVNSYPKENNLSSADIVSLEVRGDSLFKLVSGQLKPLSNMVSDYNVANGGLGVNVYNTGHLITGNLPILLTPVDIANPKQITVLNNGIESVNNLQIATSGAKVKFISGGCFTKGTLNVGESCSYDFYVPSSADGSESVNITYDNGTLSQTIMYVSQQRVITFPIINITFANKTLKLSENSTFNQNITITNSGTSDYIISGWAMNNTANYTNSISQSLELNTCAIGKKLTINESCTLAIELQTNSVESNGNIGVRISGSGGSESGTYSFYNKADFVSNYITNVYSGYLTNCALSNKGKAYCWGAAGAIGDGTGLDAKIPTLVTMPNGESFIKLSMTVFSDINAICGLAKSGKVYCWGMGFSPLPTLITMPSSGETFIDIQSNPVTSTGTARAFCGISNLYNTYCWNLNSITQVNVYGMPTFTTINFSKSSTNSIRLNMQGYGVYSGMLDTSTSFGQLTGISNNTSFSKMLTILSTTTDPDTEYYLSNIGELYSYGGNKCAQVGNGTVVNVSLPIKVSFPMTETVTDVVAENDCNINIGGAWALTASNKLYYWGKNTYGEAGNGGASIQKNPVQVPNVSGNVYYKQISSAYRGACSVTSDGKIYCWGSNLNGRLGNNTTGTGYAATPRLVTMPVNGDTFDSVSSAYRFSNNETNCAITQLGEVYCWGLNTRGQVGNNSTTTVKVPTKILFPGM